MVKASKSNTGLSRLKGHKHQSQNGDYCFNAFLSIEIGYNMVYVMYMAALDLTSRAHAHTDDMH